jgi:hypothetical protein
MTLISLVSPSADRNWLASRICANLGHVAASSPTVRDGFAFRLPYAAMDRYARVVCRLCSASARITRSAHSLKYLFDLVADRGADNV